MPIMCTVTGLLTEQYADGVSNRYMYSDLRLRRHFHAVYAVLLSADYYVSRHTRDGRCRPSFASFSPLWHVRLMGCDNWCDHATRRVTSVALQVLVSRLHCMPEGHPTAYRLYKLALDALSDEARLELRPIRLLCDGEP